MTDWWSTNHDLFSYTIHMAVKANHRLPTMPFYPVNNVLSMPLLSGSLHSEHLQEVEGVGALR